MNFIYSGIEQMKNPACQSTIHRRSVMFLFSAGCRIFQFVFNFGAYALNWRKAIPIEGAGSIQKIPGILKQAGVTKPIVVTDPGLMSLGVAQKILSALDSAGVPYALYDKVEPNPTVDTVMAIKSLYVSQQCNGFIAIGGGSAMDAAKGAAALAVFPNKTVNQLGGLLKVWKKIPPLIAVPTTAGTGSETTIAALITDSQTHHKYAIMDLHLIPLYAILDPELTAGLPPHITAATGMDALTHAVEAYLCWTYNTKESIQFALDAVKDIFANLENVYKDGNNLQARLAMLRSSYKAGFAFTRAGVGNIHAIAHTLGGIYNTPHGLANAVIMPVVLRDYGSAVHKKLARLADAAGITGAATDEEKANAFIAAIFAMNKRMGIPQGFDCIKDQDIPQMIAWAKKEANPLYPVPVIFDSARFEKIIQAIRLPK
jgi:alcohol dehydrogenase class IV